VAGQVGPLDGHGRATGDVDPEDAEPVPLEVAHERGGVRAGRREQDEQRAADRPAAQVERRRLGPA